MQSQETDEIVVDARGHRCPVPTLRLRRAVEAAPPGSVVRLLADDPLARIDVPHFAAQAGLEVLESKLDGLVLSIRVLTPETGKRRAEGGNGAPPEDVQPS
ncbi:MAG: sulfurtransferase TusA family protein [Caulobacteraceae bacterium]|nr:sulfurtransferase TusA family protein [Caulobacteraceae bacterium]